MLNRRQQINRLQKMDSLDPRQQRRLDTLQQRRQQNMPTQAQMQRGMQQPQMQQQQQQPMQQFPQPNAMGSFDTGFGQPMNMGGLPQGEPQGARPTPQFQPNYGPGPSMGAYAGWAHSGMLPQQPQSHPGYLKPQFAADAAAQPRQFQPFMQGQQNPTRRQFAQNWGGQTKGLLASKPPQV